MKLVTKSLQTFRISSQQGIDSTSDSVWRSYEANYQVILTLVTEEGMKLSLGNTRRERSSTRLTGYYQGCLGPSQEDYRGVLETPATASQGLLPYCCGSSKDKEERAADQQKKLSLPGNRQHAIGS